MNKTNKAIMIIASSTMVIILVIMGVVLVSVLNSDVSSDPVPASTVAVSETPTEQPIQTVTPTKTPIQTSSNTVVQYSMDVIRCSEWISLLSAPDINSTRLAQVPKGTSVGFIEMYSNEYYKVSYNGIVGYSLSKHLLPSNTPVLDVMTVVNCDEWISLLANSNIPDSEIDKHRLVKIPKGAQVSVLEKTNGSYYLVRYQDWVGYAKTEYLR